LNGGNNFTAFNNFSNLSVGNGLPVTKILTGAATLDFDFSANGARRQQTLDISVPGARIGDAAYLGIPPNLLPRRNFPATPTTPASTRTEPYIFQAYVSAPDVVSVTFFVMTFPNGDNTSPNLTACLNSDLTEFIFYCVEPPPGLFRVVVFSFAP